MDMTLQALCVELVNAWDKKLYEPEGELNGHHYLAREEKQRGISRAIEKIRQELEQSKTL